MSQIVDSLLDQCPGSEIRINRSSFRGNRSRPGGDPESINFRSGVWHTPSLDTSLEFILSMPKGRHDGQV
jgi:hypothetical protein